MVINITLRFILEVCALGFLTYWGFQSSQGILMKLVLGIGSPLLIAIIWGVFGSPAAPIPVQGILRTLLELLIFGLATLALYSSGKPTLAIIYAILVVVNRILIYIWDQ
ncbi:YrdB family protein [Peribacillus sp. NPDC097675]|uniref:YrdB family protein n=1 Tax=Peribacillus sp. NPDC097675 TaxID=3390618 RepID=UPI003D010D5B